jgi:hypothetical protein
MREIVVTFKTSIGNHNGFALDGGTVDHSSQRPSLVAQPSWLNHRIHVKSVAEAIGCVQVQKVKAVRVHNRFKGQLFLSGKIFATHFHLLVKSFLLVRAKKERAIFSITCSCS